MRYIFVLLFLSATYFAAQGSKENDNAARVMAGVFGNCEYGAPHLYVKNTGLAEHLGTFDEFTKTFKLSEEILMVTRAPASVDAIKEAAKTNEILSERFQSVKDYQNLEGKTVYEVASSGVCGIVYGEPPRMKPLKKSARGSILQKINRS